MVKNAFISELEKPNCEKCRYRYWLTEFGEMPATGKDCNQYGTDLCEKMNNPDFIKFMDERNEE